MYLGTPGTLSLLFPSFSKASSQKNQRDPKHMARAASNRAIGHHLPGQMPRRHRNGTRMAKIMVNMVNIGQSYLPHPMLLNAVGISAACSCLRSPFPGVFCIAWHSPARARSG